tara:strand:+ start:35375 stop:36178 length:804 start_codon:yes stop_codon:yes gene_type:complete
VLNGLDLFTGIGGITIALEGYVEPIAYCERDLYCIGLLLERMRDERIPQAPICTDVRSLRGSDFRDVDIIYGGFPCQDISSAGNGIGLGGKRSGLYWEIHRLAKETKAPFIFLENVPAIRTRGLIEVVRSLTDLGYDCRWTSNTAASVGAPHKRERWFLLAHANSDGPQAGLPTPAPYENKSLQPIRPIRTSTFTNADGERLAGFNREKPAYTEPSKSISKKWETTKPSLCRGHHGLRHRVDRLKGLGNAVVPQQARAAFEQLMGIK